MVRNAAETVDAPYATLIPGLIDLHVHLAFSGDIEHDTFRTEVAGLNHAEMALRSAGYAHRTLSPDKSPISCSIEKSEIFRSWTPIHAR